MGLAWAAPAFAQIDEEPPERVVITASLLGAVRTDLLGSSATILNPIDLENRQTRIVSDILRDVPGVAVNRLGPRRPVHRRSACAARRATTRSR